MRKYFECPMQVSFYDVEIFIDSEVEEKTDNVIKILIVCNIADAIKNKFSFIVFFLYKNL